MKINKEKMELAWTILSLVEMDFRIYGLSEQEWSISVGAFENCREQGLVLKVSKYEESMIKQATIAFSENRNSDDVVIYHNYRSDGFKNQYSEEFWSNRKLFSYDAYESIVNHIVNKILELDE